MPHQPCDPHGEWRMVNIAPGHVPRTGQVIHLVAEDAIACRRQQVEQQLARCDIQHNRRTGAEPAMSAPSGNRVWSDCFRHEVLYVRSRYFSLLLASCTYLLSAPISESWSL